MPKTEWLAPWMISASVGFLVVALFGLGVFIHSSIEKSSARMAALQDTMGDLSEVRNPGSPSGTGLIAEDYGVLQNVLGLVGGNFEDGEVDLASEDDGTVDFMILGTNGVHTDTIMIASVNEEKEKVTLFSVPRDLYFSQRRINEYYYYYGVENLEDILESVTGRHIDGYVQVDLNAFVDIVDAIGGVDVFVEKAIYDGLYPNGKGGYSAYSIDEGVHHMNGEEALKYARSRESTSDFDRAGRQQKIVDAVRDKLLGMDSVMDMKALTALFRTAMENVKTDVSLFNLVADYYDYKDYEVSSGFVLTSGNYLYSYTSPDTGAYVLLPRSGDFEEIKSVITELVN